MAELLTPSPTDGPAPTRRDNRRLRPAALVAGGLLAGGILASTMVAGAETTDPGTDGNAPSQEGFAPPGPGRGPQRAPLDSETAAQIEAAITREYPGATVIRMGALPDGTYAAHIVDADDAHVAVTLDGSFAIAGSTTLPAPLDSETAAAVEEAVLAEYPGATVVRLGALPEGGYAAHLVTAADEHVAVRLDGDFTVTGELTPEDIRGGLSDRLGRSGELLGHLSDRIDRLRQRLDRDDGAAAQSSSWVA